MTEEPQLPWEEFAWRSLPGEGWWPLIAELDRDLRALDPDYKVSQVKEKFGTLRFYTFGHGGEAFFRRILKAEHKSSETCETCGEPGEIRSDTFWLKTLCDTHARERREATGG